MGSGCVMPSPQAKTERNQAILAARRSGSTYEEIAADHNISRERAAQIVRKLERLEQYARKQAAREELG